MPRLPDSAPTPVDPAASRPGQDYVPAPAQFLYLKVPLAKEAGGYDMAHDEAIDQILREKGIGSVIGWGDSLGDRLPDGSRPAAFHRIDIEVVDLAPARAVLQQALPALGLPQGMEIHYTSGQKHLQDVYSPSGWLLGQAVS